MQTEVVAPATAISSCHPIGRTLREEVIHLARNWSLELTPREMEKLGSAVRDYLPMGTPVFVTWLAGSDFRQSAAAATRLRHAGLEPVPHMAARAIRDESKLAEMLARLRDEADVRQVLLIGGALAQPVGKFSASIQLLETGLFERYGIRRVGVAAHPEGSPDISAPALAEALAQKNAYADISDMSLELATQFCFDAVPIATWERQARDSGNRLPLAVGLAGLAGLPTLIKHARNCGVGNSVGVLFKQASKVLRLVSAVDPSDVVVGLARARQADTECSIARLHFFPFGAFEATARYAQALAEGIFEIDAATQRLSVHY